MLSLGSSLKRAYWMRQLHSWKKKNGRRVIVVFRPVSKNTYFTRMASSKSQSSEASSSTQAADQSQKSNLESFACLWLDQNVNSTQDNRDTQKELRQVINHLRTFDSSDECERYIGQITQEKVVLIVSGSLGRQVIPRLHDLPQFSACYVFCQDEKANKQWANKYHKVKHITRISIISFCLHFEGQWSFYRSGETRYSNL